MSDDIRVLSSPDEWAIRVDNGDFRLVQHPDEFDIQRDTQDWHIDTRVQSTVKVVFETVGINDAAAAIVARQGAEAAAAQAALDAVATGEDRVQTGLDAAATAADRAAVAADKVTVDAAVVTTAGHAAAAAQSASDASDDADATDADRILTAADRVQTGLDRAQTGADRVQTGLDAAATAADRIAVAADKTDTSTYRTDALNAAVAADADADQAALDRIQTGLDRAATAADRIQTGLDVTSTGNDATATAADRVQTGIDRAAAEQAAADAAVYDPAPFNAHLANTGNPHNVTYGQVGAQRDVTLVGSLELGSGLVGDRNSYIDFHAADLPADFSSRILRSPGVDGSWVFTQTGTGVISFSGGSGMSYGGQLLVLNNDARLSDARAPTAHTHPSTEITGTITDTQHGNRGGGSLHAAVVAAGASGFMTGADKTKLNGIATGATANSSDATLLAIANHTGTISDAQHGNRSGGALHANVVAAGAAGFMTGADKTKLDAVGTMANRAVTISTSAPSGGANGDVWFEV